MIVPLAVSMVNNIPSTACPNYLRNMKRLPMGAKHQCHFGGSSSERIKLWESAAVICSQSWGVGWLPASSEALRAVPSEITAGSLERDRKIGTIALCLSSYLTNVRKHVPVLTLQILALPATQDTSEFMCHMGRVGDVLFPCNCISVGLCCMRFQEPPLRKAFIPAHFLKSSFIL